MIWGGLSLLPVSADGPIQIGLYVRFEDGSVFTQCVELDGPEATGLDVLRKAELDLIFETGGFLGTAICKIGETGCEYPAQDCFCQCLGSPCQYWTYWYAEEGRWRSSSLGASARVVKDGDAEGWVWGDGQESPHEELLAKGICPASTTASPVTVEERDRDPKLSLTHAFAAPTPTQTVARTEPETGTPSSPSRTPLPVEITMTPPLPPIPTEASPAAGSPTFVWLVAGLSGLGIVFLGVAYFLTSRRP